MDEMTEEKAREMILVEQKNNGVVCWDELMRAKSYLKGRADEKKRGEGLLEGHKLILKSDCCPDVPKHGNTCPKWISEESISQYEASK